MLSAHPSLLLLLEKGLFADIKWRHEGFDCLCNDMVRKWNRTGTQKQWETELQRNVFKVHVLFKISSLLPTVELPSPRQENLKHSIVSFRRTRIKKAEEEWRYSHQQRVRLTPGRKGDLESKWGGERRYSPEASTGKDKGDYNRMKNQKRRV